MESDAHKYCEWFFKLRKAEEKNELQSLNNGSDDIIEDWSKILDTIFKLGDVLKVPGRRTKNSKSTQKCNCQEELESFKTNSCD